MKLVLIDSHALIHRAYHALPDFATASGEPTGALYGLSTMLLKLVSEFSPDYVVACYDRKEKTHRHEAFSDYKGTRKEIEGDLIKQLNTSKEIFEALNIPIYEKAGFEADDMLGTIVEQMKDNKDIEIIIASGDMDTLQLVSGDKVKVFTLKKGIKDTIVYNEKSVLERFGFLPTLIPDFKGLRGDPSDNIPGIKGIGEKTATTLITTFGTIENLYEELEKSEEKFKEIGITPRIIGLLKEGKENALFSKMLATIRRDAPIDFVLPKKHFKEGVDLKKAEEIFNKFEFRTLGTRLKETLDNKAVFSKGKKVASLSYEDGGGDSEGSDLDEEKKEKLSKEIGLLVSVVDSTVPDPKAEDLFEVTGERNQECAVEVLKERIKNEGLEKIYNLEIALSSVIDKVENIGVTVDVKYLKTLSDKYHKTLSALEAEIFNLAGGEFNINSPKQLGEILFDKLGLVAKGMKKTAGGARSTKESELLKLKDTHPIIPLILEQRELQKLVSTYIDTIPTLVDKENRLHTHFLQIGAATGRMSSQNPNLQNIPIKTELGRVIRNAFVPQKGFDFVSFDYSQIELRIAAFLSGDEKLVKIFQEGQDVHTAVASQVFKVSLLDVNSDMRRKAKVINFGILYGMGVNALRANLGGTKEEAQTYLDEYFKTFSTLATFLENIKKETREKGFTTTFWGRRRYFPEIKSKLPFLRASAERMAINAPLQGTSADFLKQAMVDIDNYFEKENLQDKVHLLIQVHDELDFEIEKSVVKKVIPEIKRMLENVVEPKEINNVPIIAHASIGKSWGELSSI
ncbi:MAG: DNA polymerase [Candidatus Paceibacterota bacterium]|jgi:DNA polymerase-1